MKKFILSLLVSSLVLGSSLPAIGTVQAAEKKVEIVLNGKKINLGDSKPFQDKQGSVMVPIRFVSQALGADLGYGKENGVTKVVVKDEKNLVEMTVGQTNALVNGKTKNYGTKIVLSNGRTYVPLRLVGEGLGQKVEWDKVSRWVWIGDKNLLTLEELGVKKESIEPYKPWFKNKEYLLKNLKDEEYKNVMIFRESSLPTALLRDTMSIEQYQDPKTKNIYLKIRSKTTATAGPIFYMTSKKDIRYRYPLDQMTIKNDDGTRYSFYKIWSSADKTLDGIIDKATLSLSDIEYIGFRGASEEYIPLMINPWKGK
ncbi:copper amine oxidase N-terminal domain-containing protein [Paenibacillus alvei]|uniref:Copper amine oxidase N-terminal domain-containing protein n=1 Tax=Paenibacillus alvei TaxID=44250 RepID=A0ABT4H2P4_PAEAL|nr:copper amine oxidase N-terminal domain-containing protein [Paenibacillus alvei]MCY9763233.1 copper amine oxidase N-terminal domain-containing protein [Paenibacillus alvei]MCY9769478.1 copper amine oxidase N-terminal domain-containing protein [Paenibacillus alvei]